MSHRGTGDEEMQRAFEAVKAAKAAKAMKARRGIKMTMQAQARALTQHKASRSPDDQHSGQNASGRQGDAASGDAASNKDP